MPSVTNVSTTLEPWAGSRPGRRQGDRHGNAGERGDDQVQEDGRSHDG